MIFFSEIRSHKYRFFKTFIFYVHYATVGLCGSLRGPAMLDLQIATSASIEDVTRILPLEATGLIVGSTTTALLVGVVDYQALMVIGGTLLGVLNIVVPYVRSVITLWFVYFLIGFFGAFIHTSGNTWLQKIWGKTTPSFMQALHFNFGLGSLAAPLLLEPFLLPLRRDAHHSHHFMRNANHSAFHIHHPYKAGDVKLYIPYALSGFLTAVTSIAFGLAFLYKRKESQHPSMQTSDGDERSLTKYQVSNKVKLFIICITGVFMFLYFSSELGSGYLLPTYAVKSALKLTKSRASMVTSAFWASFTFARLFTIFIVDRVGCQSILTFNMILLLLSNLVLIVFSEQHEWALWVGMIVMGAGLSPIFGAMFGFLGDMIEITSRVTSVIMISIGCGNFVLPYVVGKYIDIYPEVFLYCTAVAGVGCFLLYGLMVLIKLRAKKATKAASDGQTESNGKVVHKF